MAVAFVFPGQGSQSVGMGRGLAETFVAARRVFEEVDAALGEKLSDTIWNGPAETLTLTENAQPALMAVSLAALRVLEAEAGIDLARDAAFVAGHSLGEYSALAAARSLAIADAARLLRIRGRAMQKAVPVGVGAMAAASAEYSPSEWPATKAASRPRSMPASASSTRSAASETAMSAGCAFAVRVSVSGGPFQIVSLSFSPSAASTSSKTRRAATKVSASPLPMPTD